MTTLVALYDGLDRIVSVRGGLQVADQVPDVQAATTVLTGHGVTPGDWTPVGGHWPGALQADCQRIALPVCEDNPICPMTGTTTCTSDSALQRKCPE